MKTAKLITGIISLVLCIMVLFQSCAAGMADAMSASGGSSGMAGFTLALCMVIAGIVGMVTRNGKGRAGTITAAAFYLFGAIVGFACIGIFKDLAIWSTISLLFGIMYIVFVFVGRKSKVDEFE